MNADTLARIDAVAEKLFEQHELMAKALQKGDVTLLSQSIRGSQKAVAQLRYILRSVKKERE